MGLALVLLSTQSAAAETHELILLDKKPFIKPDPTTRIGSGDTVKWVTPPQGGWGKAHGHTEGLLHGRCVRLRFRDSRTR
ncbi:hypothetical protein MYX04_09105 [Nitrospiraceae bacterium AH_259_D15_M11_P09]|nr:hypothetical protein [Nitrospiraceae bacterium AH_259_D15_M11_P09]